MIKIFKIMAVLLIAVIAMVVIRMKSDAKDPYPEVTAVNVTVPGFKEVNFSFKHKHDKSKSLPFMASAVIDIDNDGTEEVFFGGGHNQPDGLFAFKNGGFEDIYGGSGLTKPDNDTTLGSVVIDVNNDTFSDLIVTRNSGIYLYTNQNGKFTGANLNVPIDEKTTLIRP
ncbi:MAG: hypothetical protein HOB18_01290 [Nitrospina sp.]|jgi:hypothetical protein|nr:hypothetical protein [Nitrospina sp.]